MKCLYQIAEEEVYTFSLEPIDSRMYCVIKGNQTLVIDPCLSEAAIEFLVEKKVKDIIVLLTHEHIDHISGVNRIRELFNYKVICTVQCAQRITDSRKNAAAYIEGMFAMRSKEELEQIKALNLLNYTCYADEVFKDEIKFCWHSLEIKCIEMPGHSPGGMIIVINEKYIFSGDNYIPGKAVITRLSGGSKKDYEKYIKPFFENLPIGCVIYPGHGNCIKI